MTRVRLAQSSGGLDLDGQQTIGRAARNVNGRAILYADRITGSMERCLEETTRRREIQEQYNAEHGITPQTIQKTVEELMLSTRVADARYEQVAKTPRVSEAQPSYADEVNLEEWAKILEQQMKEASDNLDFERAAVLRDQLLEVRTKLGTEKVTAEPSSSG